jgi:biotin operon repressor
MSDAFTADRFRWWDALAADPEMPPAAFLVGYAIATSLWRTSGSKVLVSASNGPEDVVCEAWIGAGDIADRIGMSTGTVFANIRKLEEHGYIQIDPGKPGSGHSHHYRLVEKGQPADHSKGQPKKAKGQRADYSKKPKGQPADYSSPKSVSGLTNKGQPADMNPFVPSEEKEPAEERGAPQARPATDSLKSSPLGNTRSLESPMPTIVDDESSGVAMAPPPNHGVERKSKQMRWQSKVIDQDGNDLTPPPPERRSPPGRKSNMQRGREMFGGIR